MQTLDQQEREVHQTQLRVVREQTSCLGRDLAALKTELGELKLTLGNVQSKSSSDKTLMENSQKKHMQVVDQLLKHLMEQNQLMVTQDKLVAVKDQMEQSFRDNFQKVAEAQQVLDDRAQQRLELLEKQMSEFQHLLQLQQEKQLELVQELKLDHKEQLQESHSTLQQSLDEIRAHHENTTNLHQEKLATSHGDLEQRLKELHASHNETANNHQDLAQKMEMEHGRMGDSLAKLQESHQDANGKHEALAKFVEEVAGEGGALHKKLNDMQEGAVNAVQEHVHSIRAQGRKLEAHQLSFEERLEHLEGMFTEFFERNSREAEEDKESIRLVAQRMDLLERLLGRRRRDEDLDETKRVSYSICEQLAEHDERLTGLEGSTHEQHSRLWLAIDTHAHDLSAKTLRKTPSHGSLERSPARSPPTVATMSTPMAPVLVPSMATAPIVAAPMGSAPLRLATVLPMTPMNGGQPAASFPKEVMSPSNVPKAASRQISNSLASVNTVVSMASSSRTLSPSVRPYPWPEEVERISCGRAHYDGSNPSCAEVSKG